MAIRYLVQLDILIYNKFWSENTLKGYSCVAKTKDVLGKWIPEKLSERHIPIWMQLWEKGGRSRSRLCSCCMYLHPRLVLVAQKSHALHLQHDRSLDLF